MMTIGEFNRNIKKIERLEKLIWFLLFIFYISVPWAIIVIAMGDFISGTCILFGAGILLTIIHGINGYIVTTSRKKLQEIKSIMNHNN